MSVGVKFEVETLLKKLNETFTNQNKQLSDNDIINDIIIDLSEVLTVPLSPLDFQFCISLLFGNNGLIDFCKQVASNAKYSNAKKSALDLFIKLLLEKDPSQLAKYANDLQKLSRHLYNADKTSKVKCGSLELFCLLLTTSIHHLDFLNFNFDSFVEQLCLDIRSNKGALLLRQQLKTLGVLTNALPEKVSEQLSKLIYKVLKDQLIKKTSVNQLDWTAAAGAINGLSYYFYNFPQGNDDTPEFYSEIYSHFHKLLDPSLELPKREVQRAALDLLHKHGAKFSDDLLKRYEQVFRWLLTMCRSHKPDIHKAAIPTMDTFVVVIANAIELQALENKSFSMQVLQFLLQEYNKLLETESNSSSQISLSVKGYAHLAGPCKMFLPAEDIFKMFNRILNVSQQAFFQSSEMLENKLANLPSYIESLGIIISKMELVTTSMLDSLLQLSLALTENFPYVSIFKRFLAYRAIFTLIAALKDKPNVYKMFLHTFVYQFILQTCSHLPVVETEATDGGGSFDDSFEKTQTSEWSSQTGLKGDLSNYKSFVPLWISLLNPEMASSVKVSGRPPAVLTEISSQIYCEFLECLFEVTRKLNLETFRGELEKKETTGGKSDDIVFSDPISGLQAKTPKDFQVYINLSSLVEEIIPLQSGTSLDQHYFRLLWFFVQKSSLQPLISTHYTIITTLLIAGKKSKYFESQTLSDVATSKHLLTSYTLEILQRCKQYKDQLLAACLTLILQLPVLIVTDILPSLVAPLQMSLQLGLSYHPVASVCVAAMHAWSDTLSKEMVRKYFPLVLPMLLPYLRSQESLAEAELHTRVITVRMSLASQRRKVDQRKVKDNKKVDISSLRKIQLSILQLLGNLDQDLCFSVVPTDGSIIAEKAVSWDTHKHVRFATPFQQIKLNIYLDELLPEVVDKAINSSDRPTKVAACELLHSIIILMIGTGVQRSSDLESSKPMAPVFRHLFSAMLKLSCDSDNVTRQLFLTLMYQSIHWFTNNKKFESPDTAVLLQTIMDGIITPNDPSVRDVSARYLLEFLKWSRKQAKEKNQAQVNLKSILKRIISLCKHPSAFKRLGGCLAWNSIYQEVREDEQALSIWMFEILDGLIVCLHLCEEDDPLLGTQAQCQDAIKHVERIFKVQKGLFNKLSSQRRIPESMKIDEDPSKSGTFGGVMDWLLPKIGSSSSLVRRSCMDLLVALVPLMQDCVSIQYFIEKMIKEQGLDSFIYIIENNIADKSMEVDEEEASLETFHRELSSFFKSLLSSLDCYIWIISKHLTSADKLLSHPNIQIAKEVEYFLTNYSFHKTEVILQKAKSSDSTSKLVITASQIEKLDELKCTIIIRIQDFISVLINEGCLAFLMQSIFCNEKLFLLIWECTLNPAAIGFNLEDSQVTKNLPDHFKSFLLLLISKLPKSILSLFKNVIDERLQDSKYDLENVLPKNLGRDVTIPLEHHCIIDGLKILVDGGCFVDVVKTSTASEKICAWLETVLFTNEDSETHLCDLSPKNFPVVEKCLNLAVSLDVSKTQKSLLRLITSVDFVKDSDGRSVSKGTHCLNVLGDVIMKIIIQDSALCISYCVEALLDTQFCGTLELMIKLLKYIISNAEQRQKNSFKLVNSLLQHWRVINANSGISPANKEALLTLIMAMFLADREGIIKKALRDKIEAGMLIMQFFKSYLEDINIDMASKSKALKLLPFFLTEEEAELFVKDTLQLFSSSHLPLRSTEYDVGSTKEKEFRSVILEFLTALELTGSHHLLEFVSRLFCRETLHRYEGDFHRTLSKLIPSLPTTKQRDILTFLYNLFEETKDQLMRLNIIEKVLLPCMHHANIMSTLHFFIPVVNLVVKNIRAVVCGRSDEQLKILVNKTGAFLLLQVLYSKLPKEKLFESGSEINTAFNPSDTTGKEFTKEVIKLTIQTAKGELRHDKTHYDLRRRCSCSAYNTLIAVLSNIQDNLKFYTAFLFNENSSKNEAIFEGLIDTSKKFEFDIEVSFNPSSKNRFVMIRHSRKDGQLYSSEIMDRQGTVKYMASHYLNDSSLREDVSQFDFTNSVVLSQMSFGAVDKRDSNGENDDIGLSTVRLDQSDFNEHEVMPNLSAIIHHMVDSKIMPHYDGDAPPDLSELPQWMKFLKSKLESSQPQPIKLFILRLIMNTEGVFAPYANHFVFPILNCIIDGTIGSSINYFIADLIVTIIKWGPRAFPDDNSVGRSIFSRTLKFMVSNVPHIRADIFKYNLSLVKAVVENWKTNIIVPQDIIIGMLKVQNGLKREIESGLQVSGILLVNKILPFDKEDHVARMQFNNLLISLVGARLSDIYSPAAEVLGLYLKLFVDEADLSDLFDDVVKKILELLRTQVGQGIKCLYHIQQHFPNIVEKVVNKLLSLLPQLYGISRERALQCLITNVSKMENVFIHMKEQKILDILVRKEAKTQLVTLQLVNSVLPLLKADEIEYFLPGISNFSSHPAPSCRELMYDIFTWIYDNFSDAQNGTEGIIHKEVQAKLLQGIKEEDAALRQLIKNFWIQRAKSLTLPERLLFILEKLYSPDSEDVFLIMATHLLLEATHSTADFICPIFQHALTECTFREMKVSPGWKARHASMMPLFADTQASGTDAVSSMDALISMTQRAEDETGLNENVVKATQQYLFSATQTPGRAVNDTYNWVTGSSIDVSYADKEFIASHAPTQGSSTGLLFTESNDMNRFKRKGLGKSRMNPDETDGRNSSKEGTGIESQLIRRRFVTNQDREKQTVFFARQEEGRRRLRDKLEKERKLKREAQVTIHRQYRVGELPDIQIPYKAVISPLQALAERDESTASQLFRLLAQAIIEEALTLLSPEEEAEWKDKVFRSINAIIISSDLYNTPLIRPLLQLAIANDIKLDPKAVSSACLGSSLEPLGILTLERQLLLFDEKHREPKQPAKKRQRIETLSTDSKEEKTAIWLNIADMYKNLSMWDAVNGILKSEIRDLKEETISALEFESENNYFGAYEKYVQVLCKDWEDTYVPIYEQHVWEEWFIGCAEVLGKWSEIENFVESRLVGESVDRSSGLNKIWENSRYISVFMVPLVNSKLMKVLHGAPTDGGLIRFVNDARGNPKSRLLMESELALQLSVLAVNQEKLEESRSLLSSAQISMLAKLAQCSLLTPRSVIENLKDVQPLSELQDFISLCLYSQRTDKINDIVQKWGTKGAKFTNHLVQSQFTTSLRDLYLHFLKPKMSHTDIHLINEARVCSHTSVIKAAISNSNHHLAHFHLLKLEKIPKDEIALCQFYFLKTEANLVRATAKDPKKKIQYLVEAWSKYLGQVHTYLESNCRAEIEAQYLTLESSICLQVCEAIKELNGEFDPQCKYVQTLAAKFPSVVVESTSSWYENLLSCSHKGITETVNLLDKTTSSLSNEFSVSQIHASYATLSSYYETCFENWTQYVNIGNYHRGFIKTVLKGMISGSTDAHYRFPRLISLIDQHPELADVFVAESERVPTWMFLLWLSHILIYVDKNPGLVLHPLILKIAKEYPQALVYPFEVSRKSYNFEGKNGLGAKILCERVDALLLSKFTIVYNFVSALSLVSLPHIKIKDKVTSALKCKDKSGAAALLHEVFSKFLNTINSPKNSPSEVGMVYIKPDYMDLKSFVKEALKIFVKKCGSSGEKLSSLNLSSIHGVANEWFNLFKQMEIVTEKLPNKLSSYSPWLANFSALNFKEELEIPGQYLGHCKPMPEYHCKVASFKENVMVMKSMRFPVRITINGSDEKEYRFLIKSGEDLRTDQRIESIFSLLNNMYVSDPACLHLSSKPSLITYQVVPLSQEFGILEWVDETQPFMELMIDTKDKVYKQVYKSYFDLSPYTFDSKMIKRDECIKKFQEFVNMFPWDLLRKGIFNLAVNHEGFFYLRGRFVSSYATLSISHWLLGIGDRHLSNYLLNLKNGSAIGIDFGHNFESATLFLPIPELVPFRLSPQILNVMGPMGYNGSFRETMIACLSAMKRSRQVVFAAVEAFVREPTDDWLENVKRRFGDTQEPMIIKQYSAERMDDFRKKLTGHNPTDIFVTALSKNMWVRKAKRFSDFKTIITGDGCCKFRKFQGPPSRELSAAEQVDTLIEQATDPNILGRVWIGWNPFL